MPNQKQEAKESVQWTALEEEQRNNEYELHDHYSSLVIKNDLWELIPEDMELSESQWRILCHSASWEGMPLVSAAAALSKTLAAEEIAEIALDILELHREMQSKNAELYTYQRQQVSRGEIVKLYSLVDLSPEVKEDLQRRFYPIPMVSKPRKLNNNHDSPYLTHKDSGVILGHRFNQHNEETGLDVINQQNQIPLVLDEDYLSGFDYHLTPEEIGHTSHLDKEAMQVYLDPRFIPCQEEAIQRLKERTFYIPHKVDKRGRVYTSGYQLNLQGHQKIRSLMSFPPELQEEN